MHPISYFQGIVFGLVQGVTELFPISSLGHAVVMPRLFGWNIHQNDKFFIAFLVAVHLATAIVLLGFFWRDWVRIIKGLGRSLRDRLIKRLLVPPAALAALPLDFKTRLISTLRKVVDELSHIVNPTDDDQSRRAAREAEDHNPRAVRARGKAQTRHIRRPRSGREPESSSKNSLATLLWGLPSLPQLTAGRALVRTPPSCTFSGFWIDSKQTFDTLQSFD